jgi:hypothetical protein
MKKEIESQQLEIPAATLTGWQNIVDTMAELIGVPSALIMRLVDRFRLGYGFLALKGVDQYCDGSKLKRIG